MANPRFDEHPIGRNATHDRVIIAQIQEALTSRRPSIGSGQSVQDSAPSLSHWVGRFEPGTAR
jgi:hypothetical protein